MKNAWKDPEFIDESGKPLFDIDDILSYWNCLEYKNKYIKDCSHGMKKRIMLALISLSDPDYLILDEPFSGLDFSQYCNVSEFYGDRCKHILCF